MACQRFLPRIKVISFSKSNRVFWGIYSVRPALPDLYQYAPNPLTWVDPWGLSACAPTHHLATNKHSIWSKEFRKLFKKNDLGKFKNGKWRKDVLNDPLNKIDVPGHKGPHPEHMHQEIFDRLSAASDIGKDAFRKELEQLRVDAITPGSWLNDILTKVNK
ncbi:AHH domain-containing protein [Providencia stuartii]|uniref:AHH domain-containing protein n=2 Tax=Providencia stuartii TaxID=588 RepID=UPI00288E686D|nr:AHH domain-containing protein [Providencia stuartii]MDT2017080.1 AHH domain-containing protein [Providencia stuartii]